MPDPAFQLRRGDRVDGAALADFAARTYAQTFGHATRPDDLAAYLASSYSEQLQTIELTDPNVITILAVCADSTLAGYAQVRRHPPPACVAGQDPVELWRFYVDRPWHGCGLASALLTAAMSAASELGGQTVWLSVWEENARAIGFYRKNGFRDVGTHPFVVGSDRQTDRIMTKLQGATKNLASISPFFIVKDLQVSISYYIERLGFELDFQGPDGDPYYAHVSRDGIGIMLKAILPDVLPQPNHTRHEWARWDAYVYTLDPDALFDEFSRRGATLVKTLSFIDDGLWGFEVADADGYVVAFLHLRRAEGDA